MLKITHLIFLMTLALSGEAVKRRVCIIGAGISGLVAAKYFGEYPDEFEPIVFEKNSDVGGLWIYTDSTTTDQHGFPVHSGIYKNLRAVVPKEMMTFPDYPYFGGEADKGTYMKREAVLQYLRNYTEQFNLRQYIQFNTNVEKVSPLPNMRWKIATRNLNTKKKSSSSCDATVLCNGHDVRGYIPEIPGIQSFTGRVLHSHVYREPEPFANQTVVLLGASYSAIDIGVKISSVAEKIYLSHRRQKMADVFPSNLEQVPGVIAANGDYLILSNGTKLQADVLMFCTGYVYEFPFLDPSSGIVVANGKYILSIHKHTINIERPTMAIFNVPTPGLHFQIPHVQAQYFRATLRGKISLPNRQQMLIEAQLPENLPMSKAHYSTSLQTCKYIDELALAAGGKPLPWWFIPVGNRLEEIISEDPVHYRERKLVINEDLRSFEFV